MLPAEGGERWYRIKAADEPHERVVKEIELRDTSNPEKQILSRRTRVERHSGNCQGFTFSAVPEPNACRKHKLWERGCHGLLHARSAELGSNLFTAVDVDRDYGRAARAALDHLFGAAPPTFAVRSPPSASAVAYPHFRRERRPNGRCSPFPLSIEKNAWSGHQSKFNPASQNVALIGDTRP
jgi:hypothetical protein